MPALCETCRFFDPPPAGSQSAFQPQFAQVPGWCRLLPTPVQHRPDTWCGQHQPSEAAP